MKMKRSVLLTITALFLAAIPLAGSAKDYYGYTEENPLVVACDWDFRPFEFLDSNGEPAGYNVEVLDVILDRLEIPHKFVMQEWQTASDMFYKHEADLLHAQSSYFWNRPFIQTKKYVNYYTICAARRDSIPPFPGIRSLAGVPVWPSRSTTMRLCVSVSLTPFLSMCSTCRPRRVLRV
jgi:hypothetical protein